MKMHTLAMFSTLIVSSNAFALTVNDSWKTIRQNHEVLLLQPQFAEAMGYEGLFNMCATDDEFKSLDGKIITSRTVQETFCTKHIPANETSLGNCEEYDTRTIELGKTYNLEIVKGSGKLYMHHLFSKSYTIPNCE
jgi:hypothetical protein